MIRLEIEALNGNMQALKLARPAVAMAIRHYQALEKFGALLRQEIAPTLQKLQSAQSKLDRLESWQSKREKMHRTKIDKIAERATNGFRYGQTDKQALPVAYSIGVIDGDLFLRRKQTTEIFNQ